MNAVETSRFRKGVIFRLLVQHQRNVCHLCGEMIEGGDVLAIRNNDPEPNNFYFTHTRCKPEKNPLD